MSTLSAECPPRASLAHWFAVCAAALMAVAVVGHGNAAAADAPTDEQLEHQCAQQLRDAHATWIECAARFGTDEAGRRLLESSTVGLLQSALCSGPIRVQREALVKAIKDDGDLRVDEHRLQCELVTAAAQRYSVTLTLAPV